MAVSESGIHEGAHLDHLAAGLIERAARLPGGSKPAPEFVDLPTLAEVYVRAPPCLLAPVYAAQPAAGFAPQCIPDIY
jgi:hypothetical protein